MKHKQSDFEAALRAWQPPPGWRDEDEVRRCDTLSLLSRADAIHARLRKWRAPRRHRHVQRQLDGFARERGLRATARALAAYRLRVVADGNADHRGRPRGPAGSRSAGGAWDCFLRLLADETTASVAAAWRAVRDEAAARGWHGWYRTVRGAQWAAATFVSPSAIRVRSGRAKREAARRRHLRRRPGGAKA